MRTRSVRTIERGAIERRAMPIKRGVDVYGSYFRWGLHGKKYYYTTGNKKSRDAAYEKARKQAIAARASGWKGD